MSSFGLDLALLGIAERLAMQGFAALAIDLWGDRRQFTDRRSDEHYH